MNQLFYLTLTVRLCILALAFSLTGCEPSGPPTTSTSSSEFGTIEERIGFLNRYVTFQRTYESLDFDIMYQNNAGGLVPGPSDWDIRLVAKVPAAELQAWVPAGVHPSIASDATWLGTVPTPLDLSGINEWYVDNGRTIGIDPDKRIVVYRHSSTPG